MNIPSSWSEITIYQYQLIDDILKDTTSEILDKNIKILACLLNKGVDEVEDMDVNVFKKLVEKSAFLFEPIPNFKLPVDIEIKGVKYYFEPVNPIRTFGQFVDMSVFTKDVEANTQNLHNILACLFVKKKGYKRVDHSEVAKLLRDNLTMDKAFPIALFFCEVFKKSLPIIQDYLEKEVQAQMKELEKMVKEAISLNSTMNVGAGT